MKEEVMEFPDSFDEFTDKYGFYDENEVYTNGSQLIPVFRVKQWLEHIEQMLYEENLKDYDDLGDD